MVAPSVPKTDANVAVPIGAARSYGAVGAGGSNGSFASVITRFVSYAIHHRCRIWQ